MKPYRAPICANVDELTTLLDAMDTQLAIVRTTAAQLLEAAGAELTTA